MSSLSLAVGRPTLADRVFARGIATDLALVAAGAAVTAGAAQLAVPLWPVPITGQTLAVLLVGVFLGATRGALSLALYAVLGIAGLPVFSDASSGWQVVAGPTGGYIIGFIFAGAFTGWLAQREWDRKPVWAFLAFLVGSIIPFAFGLPWLAGSLGALGLDNSVGAVLASGLYPFVIGGVVKAVLGAGIISLAWYTVRRRDARTDA